MNLFLFMIAPNTKRAMTATMDDLKQLTMTVNFEDTTERQDDMASFFNGKDDYSQALAELVQTGSYHGWDDSGECPVGISSVSMDAAKLLALDELLKSMDEDEQCSGPFTHG
jgi:hypothetical protein